MGFFRGNKAKIFKSKELVFNLNKEHIESFESIPANYKIIAESNLVCVTFYDEGVSFEVVKATTNVPNSGWLHLCYTDDIDIGKDLFISTNSLLATLDYCLEFKGFDSFTWEIFKWVTQHKLPVDVYDQPYNKEEIT